MDVRWVDDMGRIILPLEIRVALNLCEGTAVTVTLRGNEIVVTRAEEMQTTVRTSEGCFYFPGK